VAKDASTILRLIRDLARYEKAEKEVVITTETLINDGFENGRSFECTVAEIDGNVVGVALYYPRYSTWKGKYLYLEDLIVMERERGKGIGSALLKEVITIAKAQNAARLEWQVLDWNKGAIRFYEKVGATLDNEWINARLTREQMELMR